MAKDILDQHSKVDVSILKDLKIAIIHYWFVSEGGGEKVVTTIAEMFPQADIFTLVVDQEKLPEALRNRKVQPSFLQKIPFSRRFHRHFLLLQPIALEQFDLSGYDLVISSESGPAKGVITSARTCHVCYCHSPMRYLWDMHAAYKDSMNPIVRAVYSFVSSWLRVWDLATASRVDFFLANSHFVAGRIRKIYRRDSEVIYPPVDVAQHELHREHGDYYLCIGRLVDYKRVDLAVHVCSVLNRKLRVVGSGPQLERLRKIAGPSVTFAGLESSAQLLESFAHCRALLFPGEEDFGMVPIEAQSFGRPVIAYGSGGSLETVKGCWPGESVRPEHTGLFFSSQTEEALEKAILRFETVESRFSPEMIAEHARQFNKDRFETEIRVFLTRCYWAHQKNVEANRPRMI